MRLRRASERGQDNRGWLTERYSFSFAEYHDPQWMGFRSLRVLNESLIQPGTGFPMHPHQDIEVISFILEGDYTHTTSAGHRATLRRGELQVISAGSGIQHDAHNHGREPVRMLQIWIRSKEEGGAPTYVDRTPDYRNRWGLAASADGRDGSIQIRQDAEVYILEVDESVKEIVPPATARRYLYLQVADGAVQLEGLTLSAGDGVGLEAAEFPSHLKFLSPARLVLFLLD